MPYWTYVTKWCFEHVVVQKFFWIMYVCILKIKFCKAIMTILQEFQLCSAMCNELCLILSRCSAPGIYVFMRASPSRKPNIVIIHCRHPEIHITINNVWKLNSCTKMYLVTVILGILTYSMAKFTCLWVIR